MRIKCLFGFLLAASFALFLPRVEAFMIFGPPDYPAGGIPVTVEARNGATFPANLVAAGFNQGGSPELEGPLPTAQTPSIAAGFNPYAVGYIQFSDAQVPGVSATLVDAAITLGGGTAPNAMIEYANFGNLKSLAFPTLGTAYNVQTLLAQLPALNNLVLGFTYTPPPTLTVVNGPPTNPGSQLIGTELVFNQQIPGIAAAGADIKVADIDRDGSQEIIVGITDIGVNNTNRIYVFNWNGTVRQGFPVTLNNLSGYNIDSITVGNINSNPTLEIVVRQGTDYVALDANGNILFSRSNPLSAFILTPASQVMFADINGDGSDEVIDANFSSVAWPAYSIAIDAMDGNTGNNMFGFPVTVATFAATPQNTIQYRGHAVGNVDGDPALEVVMVYTAQNPTNIGQAIVFDTVTRTVESNFPFLNSNFSTNFVKLLLINMDADQQLEIAVTGTQANNTLLYVYDADGTPVPNWPQVFFPSPPSATAVSPNLYLFGGDIDNDSISEMGVYVLSQQPNLQFFNPDGSSVSGTTVQTGVSTDQNYSAERVVDVNQDGAVDALWSSSGGGQNVITVNILGNVNSNYLIPFSSVTWTPFGGTPSQIALVRGPTVGPISGFGILEIVSAASTYFPTKMTEITALRLAANNGNIFLPVAPLNLVAPYQSHGVNEKNTRAVVP